MMAWTCRYMRGDQWILMETESERLKLGQLLPPLPPLMEPPSVSCESGGGAEGDVSGASSQFPSLDWGSARRPRCSAACHACPSHAAALGSVTLGPSLKHWWRFVTVCLLSRWLLSSLKPDWRKRVKPGRGHRGRVVIVPNLVDSRGSSILLRHLSCLDLKTCSTYHIITWQRCSVLNVNCHTLIHHENYSHLNHRK